VTHSEDRPIHTSVIEVLRRPVESAHNMSEVTVALVAVLMMMYLVAIAVRR